MDHYPPSPHHPEPDPAPEPQPRVDADLSPYTPPPYPFDTQDTLPQTYVPAEPSDSSRYENVAYGPAGRADGVPPVRPPRGRHRRRLWPLIGVATLLLAALVGSGVAFAASRSAGVAAPPPAPTILTSATAQKHNQPATYVALQVSGTTITAMAPDETNVTIATGPSTVYIEKGRAITLSGIRPGARIRVTGKLKNGVIAAKKIVVLLAAKKTSGGATATPGATGALNLPPVPPDPVIPQM